MASLRLAIARPGTIVLAATIAAAIMLFIPADTHAQQTDRPPAPPQLQAEPDAQPGRARLTWNHIPDAVAYQAWYAPADGPSGRLSAKVIAPQNEQVIYGLQNNTEYRFHVMVKVGADPTKARWSLWSAPTAIRTPAGDPSAALDPTSAICDRPDLLVQGIRQALGADLPCHAITNSHLADITSLDFSQAPGITVNPETGQVDVMWDSSNDQYQGPVKVEPPDLAGLTNVTKLNLSGLGITSLSPDFLVHLPQLTHLDASHNRIEAIPDHLFAGSPNLVHVDLSYNRISAVDLQAFDGLVKLEFIDLDYNKLDSMPDQAINTSRQPNLRHVSLVFNPGSAGQLARLSIRHQSNAQRQPVFVCLVLDDDRQCVDP